MLAKNDVMQNEVLPQL